MRVIKGELGEELGVMRKVCVDRRCVGGVRIWERE